ncbi:MAG: signal peptidase I [Flavobacteriales bacterium]|nr:signal peptidase I [Flavobacteriales bacterium]
MQRLQRILTNEWFRAGGLAVAILLLNHLFILRFVRVESTSMFATLLPGDLMGVTRWATWTGLRSGDIAVFRDPLQDDRSRWQRQLLVKRVAGAPGDRVELRKGRLFVNDKEVLTPTATWSHLVRLRSDTSPTLVHRALGLPPIPTGRSFIEAPLNDSLRRQVAALTGVGTVEPMGMAGGTPRHIFPFSPNYPWNGDTYGPIRVPRKGDTLKVTMANLPLYDRLLSHYEGHALAHAGNVLLIDDQPGGTVVLDQDYYFVLGDSRHFSADSRYWGFVPADHVVGRADFVVVGKDLRTVPWNGKRWFRALD